MNYDRRPKSAAYVETLFSDTIASKTFLVQFLEKGLKANKAPGYPKVLDKKSFEFERGSDPITTNVYFSCLTADGEWRAAGALTVRMGVGHDGVRMVETLHFIGAERVG